METLLPFLIIDDETAITLMLTKLIERVFPNSPIYTYQEGPDAWHFLQKQTKPIIVICDLNLPGVSGIQILKNVRANEALKDVYFIIITADQDKDTNIKALQVGADDFVQKPFSFDQLMSKLRAAYRITNLQIELLEKNKNIDNLNLELNTAFLKIKDVIKKFQDIRLPETIQLTQEISEISTWIAKEYNPEETSIIASLEYASELAYIGRLMLNDKIIHESITINGIIKNDTMTKVPLFATELIGMIKDFDEVSKILGHIYENFDGSGYPEKLKSWQIPLGSRILRVVIEFMDIYHSKRTEPHKIIEILEVEAKRIYDYKVLTFLDQYWATKAIKNNIKLEKSVRRNDLITGMVLTRNIITESGHKLMSMGTILDGDIIDKIQSITKSDPIIGKIYIRNQPI